MQLEFMQKLREQKTSQNREQMSSGDLWGPARLKNIQLPHRSQQMCR